MFRFLERAENTARLIEAGFRIALTRSNDAESEWKSVIITSAAQQAFEARHDKYSSGNVVNFLLRDPENPSSVLSVTKSARDNARLVRTALTTEVWAAVNETWMVLTETLKRPIPETELPAVLATIRQQSALVRGALVGTMLRNDIFDFCRLGTFVERIDSTARIIDVKYYALLPSPSPSPCSPSASASALRPSANVGPLLPPPTAGRGGQSCEKLLASCRLAEAECESPALSNEPQTLV